MPEKIQRRSFAGEQRARGAGEFGDDAALGDIAAVGHAHVEAHAWIEQFECDVGGDQSRHHARFARRDDGAGVRVGGDDGVGGDIAGAAEVFVQRAAHDGFDERRQRWIGVHKREGCHFSPFTGSAPKAPGGAVTRFPLRLAYARHLPVNGEENFLLHPRG